MHYLYVGYYVDDDTFYAIQNKGINNMSVARQKFEYNLLTGLPAALKPEDTIDFVTYVPTDGVLEIPEYSELNGSRIYHIPINKKDSASLMQAFKHFLRFVKGLGQEKLQNMRVIMYDVNPVFAFALWCIKRKYKLKIASICAEVPMMRRTEDLRAWIKHVVLNAFEKMFDGYVLLAEAMAEKLPCKNKPTVVVEGVAPELFGEPSGDKANIVMYAGGLAQDNSIRQLVDCCMQTEQVDELWICGKGSEQAYVEEKAREDSRIKYFGMVENDVVRDMETRAKVLVNLRSPDASLTRYSFPSKLLEYIASGSLVVSTQLGGIPREYFDYIVPLESTDTASLSGALREIFAMDDQAYVSKCRSSQEFIQKNKNARMQAERVITFVRENFPVS